MASNLPTTRRFKFEDYSGAPEWFSNFLTTLNLFVDPVYQILDGNVGYRNIVAPQVYTAVVTAPASGNVTMNFRNPLTIVPSAVVIGNIYAGSNPAIHPTNPAVVYWHYSQGTIYIDQITNLTASTKYTVTFLVS